MQIRHRAGWAEVLAPAKINLFFAVIGRRDDGFHEIETLMAPINLCDTLVFEDDSADQVTLHASWATGLNKSGGGLAAGDSAASDLEVIPEGDKNIVVRAVRLLAQAAGVHRGAKLRLVKRIPSAAGLGGGSSDAAATLLAANLVWNLDWSIERLAYVAAQLGSDVPFFLTDSAAVCRGRGEKIESVAGLGNLHLVVVRPPEGLSTAAVYGACRPGKPPDSVDSVVKQLQTRSWPADATVAFNGLLSAARELSPAVGRVLGRLERSGCPLVGMSGSGTSCFAIARNGRQAKQLARRLQNERIGRAWAVRSV